MGKKSEIVAQLADVSGVLGGVCHELRRAAREISGAADQVGILVASSGVLRELGGTAEANEQCADLYGVLQQLVALVPEMPKGLQQQILELAKHKPSGENGECVCGAPLNPDGSCPAASCSQPGAAPADNMQRVKEDMELRNTIAEVVGGPEQEPLRVSRGQMHRGILTALDVPIMVELGVNASQAEVYAAGQRSILQGLLGGMVAMG